MPYLRGGERGSGLSAYPRDGRMVVSGGAYGKYKFILAFFAIKLCDETSLRIGSRTPKRTQEI